MSHDWNTLFTKCMEYGAWLVDFKEYITSLYKKKDKLFVENYIDKYLFYLTYPNCMKKRSVS